MKEREGSVISGQEGHWQKHANGRKVDAPGGCSPKDEVLSGLRGKLPLPIFRQCCVELETFQEEKP